MVSYPCGPPSSLDTEVRHAALVQTWAAAYFQASPRSVRLETVWLRPLSLSRTDSARHSRLFRPWIVLASGHRAPSRLTFTPGSVPRPLSSTSDSETGAWATAHRIGSSQIRSIGSASGCRHSAGSSGETAHSDVRQPTWRGLSVLCGRLWLTCHQGTAGGVDPLRY